MIKNIKLTFSIFCYISIVVAVIFLMCLIFTHKFKNRYRSFYAIFLGISKKEVLIHVTNLLNFLIMFYFLFNIEYFYTYGLIMIITINIISCIISFNPRIIIIDVIYTVISIILLLLLRLVNNYLVDIVFDSKINLLRIVFMIMIAVYVIFVAFRKMEVTVKTYKGLRRSYE